MTHAGFRRLAGGLLAALTLGMSAPAMAQDDGSGALPGRISVTGEGQATAVPDMAVVRAGVETRAETAAEALTANSRAMTAVIEELAGAGIEKREIRTSGLSVRPVVERPRDRSQPYDGEIDYFVVTNEVSVRTGDLDGIGALLDALVRSGANRIGGIGFEVSDRREALASARKAAVEDARLTAETFATAAGARLGRIVSISDRPAESGPRPELARAATMADAVAVPVERGTQRISARVFMVWELERP